MFLKLLFFSFAVVLALLAFVGVVGVLVSFDIVGVVSPVVVVMCLLLFLL